jgi:hypothetical protein
VESIHWFKAYIDRVKVCFERVLPFHVSMYIYFFWHLFGRRWFLLCFDEYLICLYMIENIYITKNDSFLQNVWYYLRGPKEFKVQTISSLFIPCLQSCCALLSSKGPDFLYVQLLSVLESSFLFYQLSKSTWLILCCWEISYEGAF